MRGRLDLVIRFVNTALSAFLALWFLLIPGILSVIFITDANMRGPGIPHSARWLHRRLTPRFERWAAARRALPSGNADVEDISGTEWPLFGSVFYLWATESLQEAWENDGRHGRAPADYARGAVEAAAALVTDPSHAAWVKEHWGDDYLHNENAFYRMLLISAMTSHARILKSDKYSVALADQVETLSAELDASPYGLVDDYPGECYPTDVLCALAAIHRADDVLGTDHSEFLQRSVRAFQGNLLDRYGLPPYAAISGSGETLGDSRGCGNSYMALNAPELWPDLAHDWYARYEENFWQYRLGAFGFREFAKDVPNRDWYSDVDSGPVIAGHGVAASAFGTGAARRNGRFDQAAPLSAQMVVTSLPLANGALALPRFLSNSVDAPYLGEAAILYCLTRQPAGGVEIVKGGGITLYVYVLLALYFLAGGMVLLTVGFRIRRWRKSLPPPSPAMRLQFVFWCALLTAALATVAMGQTIAALLLLLLAQLLPRQWQRKSKSNQAVQ